MGYVLPAEALRRRARLSVEDVALAVGVTVANVIAYESRGPCARRRALDRFYVKLLGDIAERRRGTR